MDEFFKRVSEKFEDFWRKLSAQKRMAMLGTSVGIIAAIAGLFIWAGHQSFVPLVTNLNPEDASHVIRFLKDKNVPFKVEAGGKNILVMPDVMDTLRLELAMTGLPQTSIVGYEVFDKNLIGQSSFVQKLNKKRALEGELMRTVTAMHGVRRARVHLALPERSTFVEDQKKPTASVVLDLEPGITLAERQVTGIGNLVASAVEGMDPVDVVIVDALGKTLSKNNADSLSRLSSTQIEYKSKIEHEMERRVQETLGRIVGDGRVVAQVTADLDFSSVQETKTSYDADGSAIRSQSKVSQSMEGSKPTPGGLPGAQTNLPNSTAPAPSSVKINDTKINNETVNYAVPSTVVQVSKSPGAIKRLSVAVILDGKVVKVKNADGVMETKVEQWPAERIQQFEAVVASALGIDPKRGDTLDVKNMEFSVTDLSDAEQFLADKERKVYYQNLALYGLVALLITLFFSFVVRPFVKWVTDNTTDAVETFLPQTLAELEKIQNSSGGLPGLEDAIPAMPDQLDPDKIESEMVKEKIVSLVDSNPQKAALVLKDWLVVENKSDKGAGGKAAEA